MKPITQLFDRCTTCFALYIAKPVIAANLSQNDICNRTNNTKKPFSQEVCFCPFESRQQLPLYPFLHDDKCYPWETFHNILKDEIQNYITKLHTERRITCLALYIPYPFLIRTCWKRAWWAALNQNTFHLWVCFPFIEKAFVLQIHICSQPKKQ